MSIRKFKNKQPKMGRHVYIDEASIIIGDVVLGDDVSIWPTAVIRGDVSYIRIGDKTNVQDGSVLHVSHANPHIEEKNHPLIIGQGVTIGHKAVVHACTIGDYCLIGMAAVIMDDAIIDDYVILGAGSLVLSGQKLEGGHLYLGSPAKKIRALNESETEFLRYSSQHYVELKNEYLAEQK
ncbi:MAG: gamma carbonic anhydrase family protein [Methylococcales bacterium]|nr:gamma carbonic anhydrase family protein [Methylococcales bacterium]